MKSIPIERSVHGCGLTLRVSGLTPLLRAGVSCHLSASLHDVCELY